MKPSRWFVSAAFAGMVLASPGAATAQPATAPRPANESCVVAVTSPELGALLVSLFRVRKRLDGLLVTLGTSDDVRHLQAIREETDTLIDYIFWVRDLGKVAAGADSRTSSRVSRAVLGERAHALGLGQASMKARIERELRNLRSQAAVTESRTLGVYVDRFATILMPCIAPID